MLTVAGVFMPPPLEPVSPTRFTDHVQGDALQFFVTKMKEFESAFCEQMMAGSDYTIRLEVRGNKSELVHVRLNVDSIDRPKLAQKNGHQE